LIAALIDVESRWNPRAVSDKGAMGLMQLMPATARRYGAIHPFDVEENIAAGTRYVTALTWEFHGDLRMVAAAYYAGDRWVSQKRLNYSNRRSRRRKCLIEHKPECACDKSNPCFGRLREYWRQWMQGALR
jgi:soluble lytic murein transglycosylase-like protein